MSAFHTAVQDYVEAVVTESHRDIVTPANAVLEIIEQVEERDASWALIALGDVLARPHGPYHAMTSCLCEALLRRGGDHWLIVGPIVERFRETLIAAADFHQELRRRCRAADADPVSEVRKRGTVWKTLEQEWPWQTYAASSLELFCLPLLPILAHFPPARQLLRANPAALDSAILLAREIDGLEEIVRIVEENAAEGSVDPADGVELALDQVASALALGAGAREETNAALVELYRSLDSVERALRDRALCRLGELIAGADASLLGGPGRLAGSLVETGGDPQIALDALMGRLPQFLDAGNAFLAACLADAPRGVDAAEQVKQRGAELAARMPGEAGAYQASPSFCLGVIAMLSRSPEARKRWCGDATPIEKARQLGRGVGAASFLRKMLQVLDDETLLVLEPELQRGWKVTIRGVADNFQLHTLLAGALVGPVYEGWIPGVVGVMRDGEAEPPNPGRPLDRRAVGLARNLPCTPDDLTVYSHVQLWNWEALQADGSLPDNPSATSAHIIRNEDVPADIARFEGNRLVLVGACPYARSWPSGRMFHGMHGDLAIEENLDRETVSTWLHRLATAPR